MNPAPPGPEPGPVPEITPVELKARLGRREGVLLVDVREPWEREVADLPAHGQILMPLGELIVRMDELDREAEIVVYCRSGQRSDSAARLLRHRGFDKVWNLVGGVLRWRTDVDPTLRAY